MCAQVTQLCSSLGFAQQEVNRLSRQNDNLRDSVAQRAVGTEDISAQLREAHREMENLNLRIEEERHRHK